MEFKHVPVLAQQCIDGLDIHPGGIYADATTGGGGHSLLIAERLTTGRLICIDRDQDALCAAQERLAEHLSKITFVKSNFEEVRSVLQQLEIDALDGILFDLGVSSYQLDNPDRGFSYMHDAPLDMRMDSAQSKTAYSVVNGCSEQQLCEILWQYGEERYARRIVREILQTREKAPIETTLQLVDVIRKAMPAAAKREAQHPAKRTFQAIRIFVNDELSAVEKAVRDAIGCLAAGGRIAVISFHSLEDRIVKRAFAEAVQGCTCPRDFPVCICGKKPTIRLINKSVIIADQNEQEQNPRARSAKLRIAEKL